VLLDFIFPYYSVYFKANSGARICNKASDHFHTIQSILKQFHGPCKAFDFVLFPYYSVYFKAFIDFISPEKGFTDFHTIQSILKRDHP